MKYIDANLLQEEINRRIKIHKELSEKPEMSDLKLELQMVNNNLQGIISFINSIQQEIWKPSEEQMRCLAAAVEESNENPILDSLYLDLQKLM